MTTEINTSATCSILIPSCDAYSDLWVPFFNLFFKFWQDCPFPIYLGSNAKDFPDKRVNLIYSNQGKNWTNRTRQHLETIDTEYVLLCLEDFFMRKPIQTTKILSAFNSLKELRGNMLRLIPRPSPDEVLKKYPSIGRIAEGAPYRVSTQTTIWKRKVLLDLMSEGESIWEFEVNASRRSDDLGDTFYGVWKPLMTYEHHVVERGKWFRHEAERFGRLNIGCDFTQRPIMSFSEMARYRSGKVVFYPFHALPWRWQYLIEDSIRFILRRKKRV